MSQDGLQQSEPDLSAVAAEASPAASTAERWTAPYAYSRVLSSSMKKIITTRPRMMAMKSSILAVATGSTADDGGASTSQSREQELELFAQFTEAAGRRDKEAMLTLVMQHPTLVRIQDEECRLALHFVCALTPNYYYADLIEMMVQANDESPANMNNSGQTPLHVLCQNATVTSQALSTLLIAMPAAAVMCDKRSCLPVHYLCGNPSCSLDMLWSLGQPDTYMMKNEASRTPLCCLAMTMTQAKREVLLHLLSSCPSAAASFDAEGRSVLHWICECDLVDIELLSVLLRISANAACKPDEHRDLPLHLLSQNAAVNLEMMTKLLQANPEAPYARTENDLTALHFLCASDVVSADLLDTFLAYDKHNTTASFADNFGATPLHLLCMNEAISPSALRALLLVCTDDSFVQDVHGRSPMHYLCMNPSISSELVWLFLEQTQDLVREIDTDGKTPLHHLCANKSVMAVTLEILYDACPSATVVADKDMRLPIQYLVDNPLSPPETTALLISGPASYRLRYDFLSVVGGPNATSFLRNDELVYIQTNLAIDSKASNSKVWIKFLSSACALEHEHAVIARLNTVSQRVAAHAPDTTELKDYSVAIVDDFDDAKRRVNVRQTPVGITVAPEDHIADTSVTLNYGLVTEAPVYTLEALYVEQLDDVDSIRAVVFEVGECLMFWHREALMVHGNVALECIGQFANRGLGLVHFHTSREFHQHLTIDVQSMKTTNIPPEAARVFLGNGGFEATTASDVWQFGCLIFQLATGKSLLTALAPWSESLGQTQLLHFISSLSDSVIQQAIAEVDISLRRLLQATLLTNPSQRWPIDRLMHIDAFRQSADLAAPAIVAGEPMRERLQRRADTELLTAEYQRSAKHAQDQLDFIKSEQRLLRDQFLAAKTLLREREEACEQLHNEVTTLRQQLERTQSQKLEVQQESRALARNYQSMTQQLHTTMQMLLNLVPLAKRVYGANADRFLSSLLAEASGSETTSLSTIDIGGSAGVFAAGPEPNSLDDSRGRPRRKSAVETVKSQLQNSILAHGCLHTWANSSPPSTILEPHEVSASSRSEEDPEENPDCFDDNDASQQENDGNYLNIPGVWDVSLDNDARDEEKENASPYVHGGCFLVEAEDTEED